MIAVVIVGGSVLVRKGSDGGITAHNNGVQISSGE